MIAVAFMRRLRPRFPLALLFLIGANCAAVQPPFSDSLGENEEDVRNENAIRKCQRALERDPTRSRSYGALG